MRGIPDCGQRDEGRGHPPELVVGIRPRIRRGWLHQMSTLPRGALLARARWRLPTGSHHFAGRPRPPDMTGLGDPARLSSHQRTPPAVSLQPTGTSPLPQLRLLGGPDSGQVTPAGGGGSLASAPRDPPVHLARHCQPRAAVSHHRTRGGRGAGGNHPAPAARLNRGVTHPQHAQLTRGCRGEGWQQRVLGCQPFLASSQIPKASGDAQARRTTAHEGPPDEHRPKQPSDGHGGGHG